ncbi:GlsB/YeaQ/YmgE family stress response membrane protein [Janthinobacterium sp. Mn2066]|uniref:GlsB/YeaQ/YmgE family stress response membrane protein n=1 Tax=Janthinobacterium sp. Mn2066 TaxID=3395264 RepID=UPI003BC68B9D
MNFIIWIVIGGVIGWLASMVMKTDAQQGIFLNIVVGIVGAFLGGWLLAPLFGTGTINNDNFSLSSLLVSFLGAVILLGIVNLLRRGKLR